VGVGRHGTVCEEVPQRHLLPQEPLCVVNLETNVRRMRREVEARTSVTRQKEDEKLPKTYSDVCVCAKHCAGLW
jgi:hypothetical protein